MAVGQFGAARVQRQNSTLQQRLDRAEEDLYLSRVQADASRQVLEMTLAALRAADPNSPLLDKSNRDAVRARYMSIELGKNGYKFDVKSGRVSYKT
jgi:signal transduction histidine kinase